MKKLNPMTDDEIAARISVSPFTVKTHAVRAMTKVAPATGPSSSRSRSGRASTPEAHACRWGSKEGKV